MNTQDIRINNMHDIISCLRESNGMTKKDLAEATHLSFSTVSSFCNQLMECGVLYSRKGLSVTVGRMPEHLYIRYDSFLTVCLDLQRQGLMEFAVLNLNDDVLFCKRYDISLCNGIREIVQYAYSVFCQLCSDFPNSQYLGVGVSVSGIFDKASEKIIGSAIPSMDGVPVKAIIEEIFGMPCYVDNEANLCAIGTYATHAGEDDLVYMHISEGLGIGVYTGGKLLSGHNGYGGEIAHIPFGTLGRRCPACGCVNCVETELSIPWLLQNSVWKMTDAPLMDQWAQMAEAINRGDPAYDGFLHDKGVLIGLLFSMLIDIFNPLHVYIGGDITDIFERLRPSVEHCIRSRCLRERTTSRSFLVRNNILPILCDQNSNEHMMLGLSYSMRRRWDPLCNRLV